MRAHAARVELRRLLQADGPIVAPGAMNALFARLVEQAGFPAVYMTGAGLANNLLGQPDIGLTTLTEMAQGAANMADVVSVPVIADADTGFGGPLNVERTVRMFERAGVAAIQLEDQVLPKRCGHLESKEVVPVNEMVVRVRAAISAREDPDLVVIARTDARAELGLDEALRRCTAYAEAGADVLFLEAPVDDAELERIAAELRGLPLVANMVDGGKTPLHSAAELDALGFKLVLFPGLVMRIVIQSAIDNLEILHASGDARSISDRSIAFGDLQTRVGLDELEGRVRELEAERPRVTSLA